jgi:hypothetical protein
MSASAAAQIISLAALEAANPQVANPNRIHPEKFLTSPHAPPRTMDRRRLPVTGQGFDACARAGVSSHEHAERATWRS